MTIQTTNRRADTGQATQNDEPATPTLPAPPKESPTETPKRSAPEPFTPAPDSEPTHCPRTNPDHEYETCEKR